MANPQTPPTFAPQRLGITFYIHRWAIEHRYTVLSFYMAIFILGAIALGGYMPRRMMPYVEQPLIGVITMMPGLSAEEMELQVAKPIEETVVNVRNLRYIRSTSQDGFCIVTLEFQYGVDMQRALFDVQALMNVAQSSLPATGANLKPSWVLPIDPLNLPVVSFAVTGDGWDPVELREFAASEITNRLKAIEDVYSVVTFGGYRRQFEVIVDRDKLAAHGLSILDVRDAIDAYNVSLPAGALTQGGHETIVRVDSRAQSAADLLGYPLRAARAPGAAADALQDHPRVVHLRDVARVVEGHWERRSAYRFLHHPRGGKPEVKTAIQVHVVANPDASSATLAPKIEAVARQIEAENPGLHLEEAYSNAHFVTILFDNLLEELGLAVILTALAMLLFLGEWRATLIATIVIPTSLLIAVLLLLPHGMSLNSGTLVGLLLAVGRVVDDTIIDLHAVERHLRLGRDIKTATIEGIGEVRLAVLASTFTIVLAMVPLLLAGGITQLMFVELIVPFIYALIASTIVSFTLTPILSVWFMRSEEERQADLRFGPYRWLYNTVLAPCQRLLDRSERGYGRLIDWLLHHRVANFARVLATIILGFIFYHFIGSEMMPLADVGQATGSLEMSADSSFTQTEAAVDRLTEMMAEYPEIEKASIEIGAESMLESFTPVYTGYSMPAVNGAMMMLTFSDKDERDRTIWEVMDEIQARAMAEIPGIRRLQIKEMGSDVMATSLAPVSVIIHGPDLATLAQLGRETVEIGRAMPDVFQIAANWDMTRPSWNLDIDPVRAAEVGLTPADIADQAYYALRGGLTHEFLRLPQIRQSTISIRYEADQRANLADLEQMYLATPSGEQVPLRAVADVTWRAAPTLIERDGLRRVVSVNGYYRHGHKPSMDVTMDLMMEAMAKLNFPRGYGLEARGDMTQMMDSFRRLLNGLALAVLFIFLVLVAQFRGFLQPLQMVFSLPLELSGIFFALWLAHQAFSTVSIMAVIIVTGMDITAAILLVDLIVHYRDRGVPRDRAVRTACPQRLRPILMTSTITILVMVPLAFWPKTGMDAYQPVGTTVLGGLTIGTILTLIDIPIMHTLVDDLNRWLHKRVLRRPYRWEQIAELSPEEAALIETFNAPDELAVPSAEAPTP
ncbi:MAG TPA: AcrB/AcrD/AcrF family protein [Armatimonadetes bacterium]|nr:AcrB/AcrD/AcrF family protein [Armatimonadota bacterium]